jgi:hypothetical protein
MRSLLALVLLSITVSAYAQTTDAPDTIIAQENAFWKAYVDANSADLSKLFLPEFINVEEQLMNRDQEKRGEKREKRGEKRDSLTCVIYLR